MKQEPCAFVPTREGAKEILKIAKELRLVVDSTVQPVLADGTRTIATFPVDQTEDFPVTINVQRRTLTLPPLFVDFFDWFYYPAQEITEMPLTGVHWVRLVITATYDMTKAVGSFPPEAVVNATATPNRFEWIADDPSPDYTNPFPPVATATEYYFHLAQVTNGVLTDVRASRFIWGGPSETPTPP